MAIKAGNLDALADSMALAIQTEFETLDRKSVV